MKVRVTVASVSEDTSCTARGMIQDVLYRCLKDGDLLMRVAACTWVRVMPGGLLVVPVDCVSDNTRYEMCEKGTKVIIEQT